MFIKIADYSVLSGIVDPSTSWKTSYFPVSYSSLCENIHGKSEQAPLFIKGKCKIRIYIPYLKQCIPSSLVYFFHTIGLQVIGGWICDTEEVFTLQ